MGNKKRYKQASLTQTFHLSLCLLWVAPLLLIKCKRVSHAWADAVVAVTKRTRVLSLRGVPISRRRSLVRMFPRLDTLLDFNPFGSVSVELEALLTDVAPFIRDLQPAPGHVAFVASTKMLELLPVMPNFNHGTVKFVEAVGLSLVRAKLPRLTEVQFSANDPQVGWVEWNPDFKEFILELLFYFHPQLRSLCFNGYQNCYYTCNPEFCQALAPLWIQLRALRSLASVEFLCTGQMRTVLLSLPLLEELTFLEDPSSHACAVNDFLYILGQHPRLRAASLDVHLILESVDQFKPPLFGSLRRLRLLCPTGRRCSIFCPCMDPSVCIEKGTQIGRCFANLKISCMPGLPDFGLALDAGNWNGFSGELP